MNQSGDTIQVTPMITLHSLISIWERQAHIQFLRKIEKYDFPMINVLFKQWKLNTK